MITVPRQFPPFGPESIWPFGSYAGRPVSELPSDYLDWASKREREFGRYTVAWKYALTLELERRNVEA